jgi:hypothetical protein
MRENGISLGGIRGETKKEKRGKEKIEIAAGREN